MDFSSSLEGYQVSRVDKLACLAAVKVNIAPGDFLFCFSSQLVIRPKTIVFILAFS